MTKLRARLFLLPLAQFALSGLLTIELAHDKPFGALTMTFLMQQFWWINIRNHKLTDPTDPYASTIYSLGATVGTMIAIYGTKGLL